MDRMKGFAGFLRNKYLLLFLSAVLMGASYLIPDSNYLDYDHIADNFSKTLHHKEKKALNELQTLESKVSSHSYQILFSEQPEYYENLYEQDGLVFLIFENDTLRFWTDNTVPVNNLLSKNNFDDKPVRLPTGWFAAMKLKQGNRNLIALILLKNEYPYENKYLVNEFPKEFNVKSGVQIEVNSDKSNTIRQTGTKIEKKKIADGNENFLCTLDFSLLKQSEDTPHLKILLLSLGLILLILFFTEEINSLGNKIGKTTSTFLLVATLIVLRLITIKISFPEIFYKTKLFSPELYGDADSIWLSSLGDLLINTILAALIAWYIFMQHFHEKRLGRPKIISFLLEYHIPMGTVPFILVLTVLHSSRIINHVFSSIVNNSSIPFTLNDIFSQNVYTYLSLILVAILFAIHLLLLSAAIDFIRRINNKKIGIVSVSLAIIIFIIISHLLGTVDLIIVLWPVCLFLVLFWIKENKYQNPFSIAVVLLFIISFISAHIVSKYVDQKEYAAREVFAQKLSAEQDPLAEHLFLEQETAISRDSSLISLLRHKHLKEKSTTLISNYRAESFRRQLLAKYFSRYWEKYEIHISVFDTTCMPLIGNTMADRDNLNYFEETIRNSSIPTKSKGLFYLKNSSGRINYLAHLPLVDKKDTTVHLADLFIELNSRVISDEMGFPDLMLDQKLGITPELLEYSYAKYKDNKLISYHGKFPYSLNGTFFLADTTAAAKFPLIFSLVADSYNHLVFAPTVNSFVVISKKTPGLFASATIFSYLFSFYSIFLLAILVFQIFILKEHIFFHSFRIRIQYMLIFMILFSMLFFGTATVYYIKQQYEKQTTQNLRNKMHSALVEATQEFGNETKLGLSKSDFFSYILKKLSNIFITDISLFDTQGNLVGSSQMQMFDEGLLSRKIGLDPYYNLAILQKIEFIHSEKIGRLEYLSAYCSFRNNKGELLGYLNIPYFAKQSELEKEISTILAAIINIYVFLFVISIILTVVIAGYFTKPLLLIQEKLGKIKLGKTTEPIEWKSQDEIGNLVNEYNRMIEELQLSADLLAKSERESAWREMAKQVAHEIKNPLTPMKLSVQHLQRIWDNKDPNRDEKIKRFTETMIEQIDTLSAIAGEFSNFAKMPVSSKEKVNLKTVLYHSIALFSNSPNTKIISDSAIAEACVYADKEQLLRVFNNIIKNAIQSIPDSTKGLIKISLNKSNTDFIITIEDNGIGIGDKEAQKIFTPNFTTKTTGSGLGLAMAKNIIESFNGKIWFETSKREGTIFFISIPEYIEPAAK